MPTENPSIEELLFPGVRTQNWQMMPCERIALTGILSRLKPAVSLEVGVYYGGSISLTSQYAGTVIGIDIDADVPTRFIIPQNVDIRIGNSITLIPEILEECNRLGKPISFCLVDGDHSVEGVKRDLELLLQYTPLEPMVIMVHDSGNPTCRKGICSVDFSANKYVKYVDLDFVPGQITQHSAELGRGEVWGGLCLIYLSPAQRAGDVAVTESGRLTIDVLHDHMLGASP